MKSQYSNGNIFSHVQVEKFPRHKFNLGHFNKFTCNHGLAVPFLVDDVVPGDRVDCKTFGRVQLQPLATSSMQNIKCYFRYFYVPYRLLWENWDKFMTQDPLSEVAIKVPYTSLNSVFLNANSMNVGNLLDMLGVGITNLDDEGNPLRYSDKALISFNLFRFLAYSLIWDCYFRDENLQEPLLDGPLEMNGYIPHSSVNISTLLPVAYEKDYFTTALPWPQVGEPVNLSALVVQDSPAPFYVSPNGVDIAHLSPYYGGNNAAGTFNLIPVGDAPISSSSISTPLHIDGFSTSININDLRYSNALQRFMERKALGGSRPAEFYLSMYGVRVDDLRIGQPLYLGGGFSNVSITDVASTVAQQDVPQGTLAGNGKTFPVVSFNNPYYCQEFGIVMGIMYLRPELNYMQGLPKEMQLFDTLDFYNPVFAHLGEEPVMTSELVLSQDIIIDPVRVDANNDTIFGYQSRYAYKKHKRNEVHGELKTNLKDWVLSPYFPPTTALNDEFITVDQNYNIFSVTKPSDHHYIVELYNDYEKESSMPNFVIPSL